MRLEGTAGGGAGGERGGGAAARTAVGIAVAAVAVGALAVAVLAVAVGGGPLAWGGARRVAAAPEAPVAAADWPELGGGPDRCFARPDDLCPALVPRFAFAVGGPVRASPVVAAGILYAGGDGGTMWAVDAATGEPRWRFSAAARIRAPALASDGRVFVAGGDGNVSALNASTGRLLWRFSAGGPVLAAPAAQGSTLAVAAYPGLVFGLDPATGRLRWRTAVSGETLAEPPAAADGRFFFVTGGGRLLAIDAGGGALLWAAGGARAAPPAYAWGAVVGLSEGGPWALDAASGEVFWRSKSALAGEWVGAALGPATVYAVTSEALTALDAATGAVRWTAAVPAGSLPGGGGEAFAPGGLRRPSPPSPAQVMPPLVAGGVVFWPRGAAVLAFASSDGEFLWESQLPAAAASPAALWSGSLYLGAEDGNVYALTPMCVTVDGETVRFSDAWPHLVEGRAVAPLREVMDALGGEVAWDGESALLTLDGSSIRVRPGSTAITEGLLELPVAPFLRNGRLLAPLRPLADVFGLDVEWDAAGPAVAVSRR